MAEAIIAAVALGSMYVISNHNEEQNNTNIKGHSKKMAAKKIVEGYTNMKSPPNAPPIYMKDVAQSNYPVDNSVSDKDVRKYNGSADSTDKYFDRSAHSRVSENNPPGNVGSGKLPTISMTGEIIDVNNFKHNNMQPFFGAKIKGSTASANTAESMLDNMQGQGSQMKRKEAVAPLFKPRGNLQYTNGAPNASDFLQSRVAPSMRMANIKPWNEEQVAPALNKGFTTEGSNGLNSGMEARDSWLPKTVNELRVDTNPKMTFGLDGHQGPANAFIKETTSVETQGKIEKNKPDTYYSVGESRWFTTTGLEKAQSARSEEVMRDVNRATTSCPYFGNGDAAEGEATYVKGEYGAPRRPELGCNGITNPFASGKSVPTDGDYGVSGYSSLPNNRSTTRQPQEYGGVQGMVKAIVAPILDVIRPSRKEDAIGNMRKTGNAGATVPMQPIYNPSDRTKTTIRETTEGKLDNNHLNINSQIDMGMGAYLVSKQQPATVQRATTCRSYEGSAGPAVYGRNKLYDAAYRQRNNVNKTYENRPNQGGTQIFQQNDNIQITKKDSDRNNNRMWAPSSMSQHIPSTQTYGKMNVPQYNNGKEMERIEPDILTAFKDNPYTQSLQSWA